MSWILNAKTGVLLIILLRYQRVWAEYTRQDYSHQQCHGTFSATTQLLIMCLCWSKLASSFPEKQEYSKVFLEDLDTPEDLLQSISFLYSHHHLILPVVIAMDSRTLNCRRSNAANHRFLGLFHGVRITRNVGNGWRPGITRRTLP